MIQLFGKRMPVKQRPAPMPLSTTDLGSRMNAAAEQGGGISPGTYHKEAEAAQRGLSNPFAEIGKVFNKLTQNKRKGPRPL